MQNQARSSLPAEPSRHIHRAATLQVQNRTTADTEQQKEGRPVSCRVMDEPFNIVLSERQRQLLKKLLRQRKELKQYRKDYMRMRKRMIARFKHIEQLVQTEKDYIRSLVVIIEQLQKPLLARNLVTPKESEQIFSNVETILRLHESLEKEMSKRYEMFTMSSTIGDVISRNAQFFKIYVQYVQNYETGSNFLYELAAQKPEIQALLTEFQLNNKNDARSFVVKPVQRFQKYHVLLDPIKDKTDPEHRDYKMLEDAHKAIKEVMKSVNGIINKISNSVRFNELCLQFAGDQLYKEKRQLLFEAKGFWIDRELQIPITAYFLTDLVFFVNRELTKEEQLAADQGKFSSKLSLDLHHHREFQPKIIAKYKWDRKKSSFQDVADGKTMKNLINLSTQSGYVTISTGEGHSGEKYKGEVLESLKEKYRTQQKTEQYRVEVKPLGTEQLNSTSLSKHTIYIMEIKIGEIRQNLYIRFKEMEKFASDIQEKYPELAKKRLPTLTKKFLDNHRSKTIETRKIAIFEFLQAVLNEPAIRADSAFVVRALKLRDNFYELPKIINERIDEMRRGSQDVESKKDLSFFEILCATELELGRYSFHTEQKKKTADVQQAPVEICLMTGDVERIVITEFDTVEDVCNKVSRKIGLNVNRDFRLFHQVGKKESRALDHDQVVMKLFDLKIHEETGFFAKIRSSIKEAIMPDTRPILVFKKYYYLPHQKEQEEYKRDLVRLRLLVYQVFTEIKEHKYQLSYEQYAFFGALLLYIRKNGQVEPILESKQFEVEPIIQKLIPQIIYKNESLSNESWMKKILSPLQRIKKQLDALKEHNMNRLSEVRSSTVKINLLIDKECMCYQIVLNKIKPNALYNSNLFYVQPHDTTLEMLEKQNIQIAHNMWLAITPECLAVLKPSTKENLFKLQYNSIAGKKVYPSSVIFETYEGREYRFNTYQSFEISQLVEYNKTLIKTLEHVKNKSLDLDLRIKTSVYMNDIQKYRNSQ